MSATADGNAIRPVNGVLVLSPETRTVQLHWTVKLNTPHMSYDRAVKDYEAEYALRYQILMHGEPARKK